ncbi:hypothetical protein Glove_84g58 [Diversispora epigaea]|uniref:Uncharacterized protein n=1 Tax=Diversispora epigaea TaxID=1348612 RepID=A0A397JG71_9GLOM|nr:hypothetical protein Glove_84g58 [Diversispora epigaea]
MTFTTSSIYNNFHIKINIVNNCEFIAEFQIILLHKTTLLLFDDDDDLPKLFGHLIFKAYMKKFSSYDGNTLISYYHFDIEFIDSCKLKNVLILNSNNKNNIIAIPYILPEMLRGNKFTRLLHNDQAHKIYLMIDICNGVRPRVHEFILNWILEWYLNLMYRYWSDGTTERPTAIDETTLNC